MSIEDEREPYDKQLQYLAAMVMKIEDRLDHDANRMDKFEQSMAVNNELTGDMHAMFMTGQGGLKVLGWLGGIIKWIGMFAAGSLAIYTTIYAILHGGATPK